MFYLEINQDGKGWERWASFHDRRRWVVEWWKSIVTHCYPWTQFRIRSGR